MIPLAMVVLVGCGSDWAAGSGGLGEGGFDGGGSGEGERSALNTCGDGSLLVELVEVLVGLDLSFRGAGL